MNRFFAFLTSFVSGTLAKSSEVNARFGEVVGAFDDAQGEINCAIRAPATELATDMPRLPAAVDRANKILQFDVTGAPTASMTLPADMNANAKKITGLPVPSSNSEPVTLGYLTGYSAALAGLPPLAGMAGRVLTTDGLGVQWTVPSSPGVMTTDDGAVITSFGSTPFWVLPGSNLILDPNGIWGTQYWFAAGLGGPTSLSAVVDDYGNIFRNAGVLAGSTFDHTSSEFAIGAAQALVATVDVDSSGVSAGALALAIRFYDAAHAFLSESATTPITLGVAFKRYSKAVATPVNTAFARLVVRATAINATAAGLRIRNPKAERGATPTPFSDDATRYELGRYKAQYTLGAGQVTVIHTLGDATTTSSSRDFRSAAGAQAYDARIKSTGGTNGTVGKGALDVEALVLRTTGPMGYASELDAGNGGAAITLNLQSAAYQKVTLNNAGACAITLDNTKQPLAIGRYRIKIVQDATGGRPNPTWAGITISWQGGFTPVVSAGANAVTFVDFYWDGTILFGSYSPWG
jgi:hypothetical protein